MRFLLGALFVIICIMPSRSKRQAQSAKRQAQSAARQQRDAIDAVALVNATTDTAPSAEIPAASQTALSSWLRSKRQAQSAARYSRAIPPSTLLPSPADGFLLGAKTSIKLIHPISNGFMNQESPRKQKRVKK